MARLHRNSLFAIEQSITKKAVRERHLNTQPMPEPAPPSPTFVAHIERPVAPAVAPHAPMAELVAKPLQLGFAEQNITMQENGITIETHLVAQPLQSLSQSTFFDGPAVIEETLRNSEHNTLQQRSDVTTERQPEQARELVSKPRVEQAIEAPEPKATIYDDEDDFLSELDAITSMAASRKEKKVPQQFSHEVDAFQKELDSMVGKPPKAPNGSEPGKENENDSEDRHYKGTSSGLSTHQIFEGSAAKKYANSFNLGTVNIGDRFDQFDIELEREDQKTRQKIAQDLGISDFDVVADLSELSTQASADVAEPNPIAKPSSVIDYQVPIVLRSETVTPWAAGAAMLLAWQGQWSVDGLLSGAAPWAEYVSLLSATGPEQLADWGLELIASPQSYEEWQAQLAARGPLLLGSGDQVMVLTQLGDDCYLIRTDQGATTVGFDDFEETLARLQLSGQFVVAALASELSHSIPRDSKDIT